MITEKMTIHKALVELKTLDDRINKAITNSEFVAANKHSSQTCKGLPVSEWRDLVKANYQKITDLISRRNAIKRGVVLSNATTTVTIGGKEYSVAEAIELKNHGMDNKIELCGRIERNYSMSTLEVGRNNGEKLEDKADTYVTTLYGNSEMKNISEEVQKVRKDFIASQTYELVDPLGAEKIIETLNKEINDFLVEVDSALSVSNALTEIEISY